jgi:hypothetical protein
VLGLPSARRARASGSPKDSVSTRVEPGSCLRACAGALRLVQGETVLHEFPMARPAKYLPAESGTPSARRMGHPLCASVACRLYEIQSCRISPAAWWTRSAGGYSVRWSRLVLSFGQVLSRYFYCAERMLLGPVCDWAALCVDRGRLTRETRTSGCPCPCRSATDRKKRDLCSTRSVQVATSSPQLLSLPRDSVQGRGYWLTGSSPYTSFPNGNQPSKSRRPNQRA